MTHPQISQVDLYVDDAEKRRVLESLDARWLSEGPFCAELRKRIVAETGSKAAYLAPNGTLGLYLALLALDLPAGSEVIVPSFTFYGSAMSVVFAGLKPVFVDVDERTFQATAAHFEAAVTPRTSAIMPVHIYGQCSQMPEISAMARRHGLRVVEDAAQAYGVKLDGKAAGSFGDIGVFSFYSDKTVTMGEGAALVTDDDEIGARIALLRNQGRPNAGTFVHPSLGMNFRITDIQAAIGVSQLDKLAEIIEGKKRKWSRYEEGLRDVGDLRFMDVTPGSDLIPFRFPILTADRDGLMRSLEANAIQTRGFFYPMHLQPKLAANPPQSLPVSEKLSAQGICLPVHRYISDADIDRIVGVIRGHFG